MTRTAGEGRQRLQRRSKRYDRAVERGRRTGVGGSELRETGVAVCARRTRRPRDERRRRRVVQEAQQPRCASSTFAIACCARTHQTFFWTQGLTFQMPISVKIVTRTSSIDSSQSYGLVSSLERSLQREGGPRCFLQWGMATCLQGLFFSRLKY